MGFFWNLVKIGISVNNFPDKFLKIRCLNQKIVVTKSFVTNPIVNNLREPQPMQSARNKEPFTWIIPIHTIRLQRHKTCLNHRGKHRSMDDELFETISLFRASFRVDVRFERTKMLLYALFGLRRRSWWTQKFRDTQVSEEWRRRKMQFRGRRVHNDSGIPAWANKRVN